MNDINYTLPNLNETANIMFRGDIPFECMTKTNAFSSNCLYKTICPQFNNFFIKIGLIIVISYLVISWLKWWYFKHGYKRFPIKNKFIGNIQELNTRVFWDLWIQKKYIKFMLGYIVVVVILSLGIY